MTAGTHKATPATAATLDRAFVKQLASSDARLAVTIRETGRAPHPGALFVVSLPIGNDDDLSRRAIVVLTDGEDTASMVSEDQLLDVARRIFNGHLSDTIDMLRQVEAEPEGVATR